MRDLSVRQYVFGDFILEPKEARLLRMRLERIDLTGKPFEVLVLLVESRGSLVTREQLLQEVWGGGTSVTDQVVTEAIYRIRRILDPKAPNKFIRTETGRGYRFVADVSALKEPLSVVAAVDDEPQHRRLRAIITVGVLTVLIASGIILLTLHIRTSSRTMGETPYRRAILLERDGDDDRALETLKQVPSSDPMFAKANLKAAWLLYQADKDDEASEYLDLIPQVGGPSSTSPLTPDGTQLKAKAIRMLVEGDSRDALTDFRLAADADPTDVEAQVYVADVAVSNGSLQDANDALAKCKALDRTNPFCGYDRIEALTYEGRFEDAIAEFDFLRRTSKYPWLDEPAGDAELARGDVLKARAHYRALADLGGQGRLYHFMAAQDGIAAADFLEGNLADAHRELMHAIDQTESGYERADYFLQLANSDALTGDRVHAKEEAAKALELSDSEELLLPMVRTLALIGDYSQAHSLLRKHQGAALRLGPKFAAVQDFVDGVESLNGKDFAKATQLFTSSLRIDQNPEAAFFRAKAEMGKDDWRSAADDLTWILGNRGKVILGSAASLIPLTEDDLKTCKQRM